MGKKTQFDSNWQDFEREANERADELNGAPLKFEVGKPVVGIFNGIEVMTRKGKMKKDDKKEMNIVLLTLPDGRNVRYWSFGLLDFYFRKFKTENGMRVYIEKLPKKKMADGNSAWGLKFYQKAAK